MDSLQSRPTPPVTPAAVARLTRTAPSRRATNCPECGKELLQKTLQRHIETHHSKRTAFRCGQCNTTFYRKDHLARHIREKHDDTSETVGCVYCGKQVRQRYLSEHWKGQKCIDAQDSKIEMPKSLDTESVLDSLVICASLLSLSLEALSMVDDTADYVLKAPEPVGCILFGEIWKLRGLAIRQVRNMFSKILDPASPHRENIVVWSQMDILLKVDHLLFGEHSEQYNTHLEHMCGLDWCFTHQNEFLPQFEEAIEDSERKAKKQNPRSSTLYDSVDFGEFYSWVSPITSHEDRNGKQITTILIPPSLKYGDLLVNHPRISTHGEEHFVFDASNSTRNWRYD